ncbi:MAG: Gfo/Idh/MocA family oxidoreductase [Planctomycetota bacterium]|nr:MAG: Gfo/Idh/MocA family oxidoreductase [Planctomycetota bacterium]
MLGSITAGASRRVARMDKRYDPALSISADPHSPGIQMLSRRQLIRSAAATSGAAAAATLLGNSLLASAAPRGRKLDKVRILQVGVGGSIAPYDREQLEGHKDVVFTGLCDVDSNALAEVAKSHPDAFTCKDFREAFDQHADKFDAVLVCTPDHNHALIMMTAMKAGKHVYGQKPLVQQLSEVAAMEAAIRARPDLITQVGNQRMGPVGRQYAVDILKRNLLGRAVAAHVWVNGPPDEGDGYFYYGGLKEPTEPPPNIDWKLWLGAAEDAPYREGLVGLRWRSSWDYGTGQLGDWCTHLLDVLYYAYDLDSPLAVLSHTRRPSDFYHAQHVHATLSFPGGGRQFAGPIFPVHYCDRGQIPSRAALGLPPGTFEATGTLVQCENGVLYVAPEGHTEVWRDGKPVDWQKLPGLGQMTERNHWHSWVDKILGRPGTFVQTPFSAGARMAEAGLLCAKAARFPGQELRWDKSSLSFTNHEEATNSIVRRAYRPGFELPVF